MRYSDADIEYFVQNAHKPVDYDVGRIPKTLSAERWTLARACLDGDRDLAENVAHYEEEDDEKWKLALYCACRGGHLEIVEWVLAQPRYEYVVDALTGGDSVNMGLMNACIGGHTRIVEFLVETHKAHNFVLALQGACFGGHEGIVESVMYRIRVERGDVDHAWKYGFYSACRGGHLSLVERMCAESARDGVELDWNVGLRIACAEGHLYVVEWIGSAALRIDWTIGLHCAQNYEILEFLISKIGESGAKIDWNACFRGACASGDMRSVDFVLQHANAPLDWYGALIVACKGGHLEILEKVVEYRAGSGCSSCLEFGLMYAGRRGDLNVAKRMVRCWERETGANSALPRWFAHPE